MFVGRKRELKELDTLYATERFQFAVIYGRRRVGKTALISEFVSGKPAIFFTAVESNARQNLENLSQCIMNYALNAPQAPVFESFQAAIEYVFKLAEQRRLVFVIDEYPYAAKASKSLASTLQMLIDRHSAESKLFLILCGSSMSFMEDNVLAYKAPLYGRKTAQIKLMPFDFFDSRLCLKRLSPTDMATLYGVVGGMPRYLVWLDDTLSVEDNIKRNILNPSAALFEEPINLIKQEVREPAIYNAIIAAITGGASRLSEISGKVGEDTSACAVYIKNLIALGVVKKETPIVEKSTRRTIYTINDNMFRFWYRFIPGNISAINRGLSDIVYRRIEPEIPSFMGAVFEEICMQYLWRLNARGEAAFQFTELGRWWGNDPKLKREVEIDIMGTDGEQVLLGECKWTNQYVDTGVLESLVEKSRLFSYAQIHLCVFAKTGFTKSCIAKAAERKNVTLTAFDDICSRDYDI